MQHVSRVALFFFLAFSLQRICASAFTVELITNSDSNTMTVKSKTECQSLHNCVHKIVTVEQNEVFRGNNYNEDCPMLRRQSLTLPSEEQTKSVQIGASDGETARAK